MDQTIREIGDEDFMAPGGARFTIEASPMGLFYVKMNNGGKRPSICEDRFTSYKKARYELVNYIKNITQYKPSKKAAPTDKE